MKRLLGLMLLAGMSMSLCLPARAATDMEKLNSRLDNARAVIDQIMAVPDKAVPDGITKQAVCIGVVPSMVKGAFIIGAEYGQGVVTCRTHHGWSAPVFIRMAGGSFGFQIGGQGTDLVLVAINHKGFTDLLKSKFKIGGDASAAAGPVGRDTQAATDLSMRAELLTWSRSRGLFAGIDLNGVSVSQNSDDTNAFYGSDHTFEQILHGDVAPPETARPFLRAISRYFGTAQVRSGE